MSSLPRSRQDARHRVLFRTAEASYEDLLAVILSTGQRGRDVFQLSREIARRSGDPGGLRELDPAALIQMRGIGRARAAALIAAVEMGRRTRAGSLDEPGPLFAREIAAWLDARLQDDEAERFYLFSLNRRRALIQYHLLAAGGANSVQVYLRDLIKLLLNDRASYALIAHNHPEGRAAPTPEDLASMARLQALLRDLGIGLLDQFIVGREGVYSCDRRRLLIAREGGKNSFPAGAAAVRLSQQALE